MQIRFAKDFDDKPSSGRLKFYGFVSEKGLTKLETPEHKHAQTEPWGPPYWDTDSPKAVLPLDFWDERTEVRLEDIPSPTPQVPLLCFWTSTAIIDVYATGREKWFKTSTGKSVGIGLLRVFVPSGEVRKLELIVMGIVIVSLWDILFVGGLYVGIVKKSLLTEAIFYSEIGDASRR